MRLRVVLAASVIGLLAASAVVISGQRGGAFRASRDHPAIAYSTGPVDNAVVDLNRQIRDGVVRLEREGPSGYLASVLDALEISVESQVAVFSQTSFQARRISSQNPRAIYFTDSVAVAWVRGGDILEVAAQDSRLGAVFYTLDQTQTETPQFTRDDGCLACHLSWDTLAVPGLQVLSVAPMSSDPNVYAGGYVSDHRTSWEHRWGGWYVTGKPGSVTHMGNVEVTDVDDPEPSRVTSTPPLESLTSRVDVDGYLSSHSDVVALMVLEHQAHMTNLITRLGWEAHRVMFRDAADPGVGEELIAEAAAELVDYLLFVDEVPLIAPVIGSSGFADQFAARAPRDRHGRSLREFDLERRLFRYPCSYMIYTKAFDALPKMAKVAVYERMWDVLSGRAAGARYARLTRADRQAVVEILRDTKSDLPDDYRTVMP